MRFGLQNYYIFSNHPNIYGKNLFFYDFCLFLWELLYLLALPTSN